MQIIPNGVKVYILMDHPWRSGIEYWIRAKILVFEKWILQWVYVMKYGSYKRLFKIVSSIGLYIKC